MMTKRSKEMKKLRDVRVAVCGHLPTVCDYLTAQGVINIDKYTDAVEIRRESDYHLILVYAPQAEGLLNTFVQSGSDGESAVPIRLLGEPCCHAILVEIKMMLRGIADRIQSEG